MSLKRREGRQSSRELHFADSGGAWGCGGIVLPVFVAATIVVKEGQLAGGVAHGVRREDNSPAYLCICGRQLFVASCVHRVGLKLDGACRFPALGCVAKVFVKDRHERRIGVRLWLKKEACMHADVGSGVNKPGQEHAQT